MFYWLLSGLGATYCFVCPAFSLFRRFQGAYCPLTQLGALSFWYGSGFRELGGGVRAERWKERGRGRAGGRRWGEGEGLGLGVPYFNTFFLKEPL